jgi:hypothetical protein
MRFAPPFLCRCIDERVAILNAAFVSPIADAEIGT